MKKLLALTAVLGLSASASFALTQAQVTDYLVERGYELVSVEKSASTIVFDAMGEAGARTLTYDAQTGALLFDTATALTQIEDTSATPAAPSGREDEDDFEGQRFGFDGSDEDAQLSAFTPDFTIDEGGEN